MDHCRDYLQRYYRSFLNDQEKHEFEHLRTINQAASGSFAILLPFSLVYSFSTKYNATMYLPKTI